MSWGLLICRVTGGFQFNCLWISCFLSGGQYNTGIEYTFQSSLTNALSNERKLRKHYFKVISRKWSQILYTNGVQLLFHISTHNRKWIEISCCCWKEMNKCSLTTPKLQALGSGFLQWAYVSAGELSNEGRFLVPTLELLIL